MNLKYWEQPYSKREIQQLAACFEAVFGQAPSPEFGERLNEKYKPIAIVSEAESQLVGFKVGYELYRGTFFSWLGGVLDGHRRRGWAREMMLEQHKQCRELGYQYIETETFADQSGKAMLFLNMNEGFEIFGTLTGTDGKLRVRLRKTLL